MLENLPTSVFKSRRDSGLLFGGTLYIEILHEIW